MRPAWWIYFVQPIYTVIGDPTNTTIGRQQVFEKRMQDITCAELPWLPYVGDHIQVSPHSCKRVAVESVDFNIPRQCITIRLAPLMFSADVWRETVPNYHKDGWEVTQEHDPK